MIDKEKQIKEMMKDLQKIKYSIPDEEDARYRIITCLDRQSCKELAVPLVNAGYRKQSETVREFVRKLKSDYDNDKGNLYVISEERLNELAAQYGVEVEE